MLNYKRYFHFHRIFNRVQWTKSLPINLFTLNEKRWYRQFIFVIVWIWLKNAVFQFFYTIGLTNISNAIYCTLCICYYTKYILPFDIQPPLKVSEFQKQIFLFSLKTKNRTKLFSYLCPEDLKWPALLQ